MNKGSGLKNSGFRFGFGFGSSHKIGVRVWVWVRVLVRYRTRYFFNQSKNEESKNELNLINKYPTIFEIFTQSLLDDRNILEIINFQEILKAGIHLILPYTN